MSSPFDVVKQGPPEPVAGYDYPLPNGCWKCIGCGKLISPKRHWNQCSECDTRDPEDY